MPNPPITEDGFGLWRGLGVVQPSTERWIKFPTRTITGHETIRLEFLGDTDKAKYSYARIRQVYEYNGESVVLPSLRYYPSLEKKILLFPVPNDFELRGRDSRSLEVRKFFRWRRSIGITPDSNWKLKAEEIYS